jgi:hypothetical protein
VKLTVGRSPSNLGGTSFTAISLAIELVAWKRGF